MTSQQIRYFLRSPLNRQIEGCVVDFAANRIQVCSGQNQRLGDIRVGIGRRRYVQWADGRHPLGQKPGQRAPVVDARTAIEQCADHGWMIAMLRAQADGRRMSFLALMSAFASTSTRTTPGSLPTQATKWSGV